MLWVWALLGVRAQEPAEGVLERIQAKMKENLARVPDYVCLQTIERSSRDSERAPAKVLDTLRLEVGFVGDKEVFSWRGARRFEEKELGEMIGAGVVGTGSFAIHAANVFLSGAPEFSFRGRETIHERPALRYDYVVPVDLSRYRIRVPPREAIVPFYGSFWVDAETLDLIRLEVHAEEIDPALRLAKVSDVMEYARVAIGDSDFLLPASSELTMLGALGDENRNRRTLEGCRQYSAQSSVVFDEPGSPVRREGTGPAIPPGLRVELSLDTEIDPERAALGDPIRAVLSRPLKDGETVLVPQGAVVLGRLVRLEKSEISVPHYIVGLELHTLEVNGEQIEFFATMTQAGPAAGLIREAKKLDPTFTKDRAVRFDILVRERQRGQGILHWEAKRPRIPRGLRMRWETCAGL